MFCEFLAIVADTNDLGRPHSSVAVCEGSAKRGWEWSTMVYRYLTLTQDEFLKLTEDDQCPVVFH